jgi:hypothetical protein
VVGAVYRGDWDCGCAWDRDEVPRTGAKGSWNAKGRDGGVVLGTDESISISSLMISLPS